MILKLLALLLVFLLPQVGCYNTYNVPLKELAKAQEGGQVAAVQVKTASGETVIVSKNTKIGVTDTDDVFRQISPFNFTLGRTQLIAPDEDLLIPTSAIKHGYVKEVSGTKTLLVVLTGLAAIIGGGLYITLTAEEEKGFGQ